MRRQPAAQYLEAQKQHIDRKHVRLTEIQYTVNILRQQEQW
jgi:hypothetical protein